MEQTQKRSRAQALRRFAGTRRGATVIAAAAAALAGLLLLAFVGSYKSSVQGGTATRSVLVASRLIPKGTSGSVVVSDRMFELSTVQKDQLEAGAVTSAAAVGSKVATRDIYPGQQITAADFGDGADPIRGELTGLQRAITVPLDESHGMVGVLHAGDHVDVLAGFNLANAVSGRGRPALRTLVQDVLVLKAPGAPRSNNNSDKLAITVRLTADEAAQVAFASDAGLVWFVLRPPAGAKDAQPSAVTLDALLAGKPTIEVGR
ncbi:MAG: Flp pilus assembly protein CpaB [Solirubrobacteraceae bacterium]